MEWSALLIFTVAVVITIIVKPIKLTYSSKLTGYSIEPYD